VARFATREIVTCIRARATSTRRGRCRAGGSFLGFGVTARRRAGPIAGESSADEVAAVNWRELCTEAGEGSWRAVEVDKEGNPRRLGEEVA